MASAAAAIGLIGSRAAIDRLEARASVEARTVLDLLRGGPVEPGPEPQGEIVEIFGRERRVYTFDELAAAHAPAWTALRLNAFRRLYEQLLERWLAERHARN